MKREWAGGKDEEKFRNQHARARETAGHASSHAKRCLAWGCEKCTAPCASVEPSGYSRTEKRDMTYTA